MATKITIDMDASRAVRGMETLARTAKELSESTRTLDSSAQSAGTSIDAVGAKAEDEARRIVSARDASDQAASSIDKLASAETQLAETMTRVSQEAATQSAAVSQLATTVATAQASISASLTSTSASSLGNLASSAKSTGLAVKTATSKIEGATKAAAQLAGTFGVLDSSVASTIGGFGGLVGVLGKTGGAVAALTGTVLSLRHIWGVWTGDTEKQIGFLNSIADSILTFTERITGLNLGMEASNRATEESKKAIEELASSMERASSERAKLQSQFVEMRESFRKTREESAEEDLLRSQLSLTSDVASLEERRIKLLIEEEGLHERMVAGQLDQVEAIGKEVKLQREIQLVEERIGQLRDEERRRRQEEYEARKRQVEEERRAAERARQEEMDYYRRRAEEAQRAHEEEMRRIEEETQARVRGIFVASRARDAERKREEQAQARSTTSQGAEAAPGGGGPVNRIRGIFARHNMRVMMQEGGLFLGDAVGLPGVVGQFGPGGVPLDQFGRPRMRGAAPMGGPDGGEAPGGLEGAIRAEFDRRMERVDEHAIKRRAWKQFREREGLGLSDQELTVQRRRIFGEGMTSDERQKALEELRDEAEREIQERLKALEKQGILNEKQVELTKRAVEEYRKTQEQLERQQADLDTVMQTLNITAAGANNREARRRALRGGRGN